MTAETKPKPSFPARFGRFLLRILFVLVLGIALGAGVYFGVQVVYRVYIQPAQGYAVRLDALETGQIQAEQLIIRRFDTLAERLDALEAQSDTTKESLAELKQRLFEVETAQQAQAAELTALSDDMAAVQAEVSDLQTSQAAMQAELEDFQQAVADLDGLQTDFDQAMQTILESSQKLDTLSLEAQDSASIWSTLQVDIKLLQTMEVLTRSRFFLTQGNVSLAQAEIRAAASLLTELQDQVSEQQASYLSEAVAVLNESLSYLPRSPLLASDRVEGVWQMLFVGLPEEPTEDTAPESTPTATSTP